MFHQWTIGPIVSSSFSRSNISSYLSLGCQYYATLVVAETFGSSSSSQILNLNANNGNIFTPGYTVYKGGSLSKLALFNFMTDPSGNNDYTATISIRPATIPVQVKVMYLSAPSVSSKNNTTWVGQMFGANFALDGHLQGDLNVQTIPCDTNSNTCQIKVPAPGFALVFFSDNVFSEVTPSSPQTFAMTTVTKMENMVTVDPSVLATSNGHAGVDRDRSLGSMSRGSENGAGGVRTIAPGWIAALVLAVGALALSLQL